MPMLSNLDQGPPTSAAPLPGGYTQGAGYQGYDPQTGADPGLHENGNGVANSYDPSGNFITSTPGALNTTAGASGAGGVGYENNGIGIDQVASGYAPAMNAAAGMADYYLSQGANQNQSAPTINNPYAKQSLNQINGNVAGMNALNSQLGKTAANGQNSQAYQQYASGVSQGLLATTALGNSAQGGAVAGAGARRAAQEQNGQARAASLAPGQQVAASAQQAAQQQQAQLLAQKGSIQNQQYQQTQAAALQQAQLQSQQKALNNQAQVGYNTLSQNQLGTYLNAVQGANNQLLAKQGLGQNIQSVNNAQFATELGAATGGGGALASAAASGFGGGSGTTGTNLAGMV